MHARQPRGDAGALLEEGDVNKLAIPHDAMIFVGDGRKALFLRNDGDGKFPNLKTEQVFTEEKPSSHEQVPGAREKPRALRRTVTLPTPP